MFSSNKPHKRQEQLHGRPLHVSSRSASQYRSARDTSQGHSKAVNVCFSMSHEFAAVASWCVTGMLRFTFRLVQEWVAPLRRMVPGRRLSSFAAAAPAHLEALSRAALGRLRVVRRGHVQMFVDGKSRPVPACFDVEARAGCGPAPWSPVHVQSGLFARIVSRMSLSAGAP